MERRSHPRRPSSSSSNPSTNHRISNPNHYPGNTNNSRQRKSNCQDVISHEAPSIVGTCPFMCPVGERIRREQLRDLAVFERLDGNPRRTSPDLAVKKFCRTISIKDSQASDVRPLLVLEDTLNYLLNLMDSAEYPFEVVHDFVFDRTRSIRQDLSIQNIINDQAIRLLEKMSKLYILSHHKLRSCHGCPNTSSMSYLNMEQLTKSLMSLYNLYEANRKSDYVHENEAEFLSFYVLLHLGSISQPTGESLSPWFHNVPPHIIKSKEMRFARQVLRFFRMGNYKQFLCTVAAEASYLQYCILESNISEVRALALSYINHGCYKLHPYPLAHLSKLLMMKESDVESLCKCCGLEIFTDEVGDKFLPTKQTSFCWPKEGLQKYCFLGLEQYARKTAA